MNAYITVVTNNEYVPGVIALYRSLRYVQSDYQLLVGFTDNVTAIEDIERHGARTVRLKPPRLSEDFQKRHSTESIHKNTFLGRKPSFHNTLQNFIKIEIWNLDGFDKMVFLDADTLVLKNPDRLFQFPAFSAAPNLYAAVQDLNRMNSGVFVFKPDKGIYEDMIETLNRRDSFYKRTDQTFLQAYFPDWHGLPYTYNVLQYVYMNLPEIWVWNNLKIVHFQYEKPWDLFHEKKELFKDLIELWSLFFEKGEIPPGFIENLSDPGPINRGR